MSPKEMQKKLRELLAEADAIVQKIGDEGRDMTDDERTKLDANMAEAKRLGEILKLRKDIADQTAPIEAAEKAEIEAKEAAARAAKTLPVSKPGPDATIGMGEKDTRQYSLVRLIRSLSDPDPNHRGVEAAFELECSRAVEKRLGRAPKGVFVPADVLTAPFQNRPAQLRTDVTTNISKGTSTAGGYLVGTELQPQNFIEALRNKLVIYQAGARVITGLVGNVDIPSQTATATYYWVAENYNITQSALAVGKVSLVPMTGGAFTAISRLMIQQSTPDIEALVRDDLTRVCADGIQQAALHGTGTGEPFGIASTTGVSEVIMGTQGGYPVWAKMVEFESDVANNNADVSTMAWIMNSKFRGKLRTMTKLDTLATVADYIWDRDNTVLGYPAYVTNSVKSDYTETTTGLSYCFFGCWNQLLIGLWGTGLDILVDPYVLAQAGAIRVIALQEVAIAVRHPKSFAFSKDIITT